MVRVYFLEVLQSGRLTLTGSSHYEAARVPTAFNYMEVAGLVKRFL